MGFWGEFLIGLTLGVYTPKDRRVNNFRAGDRVYDVYFGRCLKAGMTMATVEDIMLPAIPYEPESNNSQLVYLFSHEELNKVVWRKLTLRFINDRLLPDGEFIL